MTETINQQQPQIPGCASYVLQHGTSVTNLTIGITGKKGAGRTIYVDAVALVAPAAGLGVVLVSYMDAIIKIGALASAQHTTSPMETVALATAGVIVLSLRVWDQGEFTGV
jgi:hypothetical protein